MHMIDVLGNHRGQSAIEYIVFLGTISAAVYFAAPTLVALRETTNDIFVCAARRIHSDGRWRDDPGIPNPCR